MWPADVSGQERHHPRAGKDLTRPGDGYSHFADGYGSEGTVVPVGNSEAADSRATAHICEAFLRTRQERAKE